MAAYRSQKTISPKEAEFAIVPKEQAANIIFKSEDGGKTWQDFSLGLPEKMQVRCVYSEGGEIFLGAEGGGLYHGSNPNMGLWEREEVGGIFSNFSGIFPSERVIGIFPGHSGPYACISQGGFFRKIKGTSLWQPMHNSLEDNSVREVVEIPDGTIFVTCHNGIYKSEDDCKTWKHVFSKGWVSGLVTEGDVLVCSGADGLFRSADKGEHWAQVLSDKDVSYNTSVIQGRFAAVSLAASRRNSAIVNSLHTSADGGKTWQLMNDTQWPVQDIYELKQAGKYLFSSNKNGISCSTDGGKNWELVRPSTDTSKMVLLHLAVSGQTVFFVIMREGC